MTQIVVSIDCTVGSRRGGQMGWAWYAVKTVFRTEAEGEPTALDAHYDPDTTLVEERIVVLKARSHEEALRRADKQVCRYVSDPHINPYGQPVRTRYLGHCTSFELFDEALESGAEVWSDTYLMSRALSDEAVCERFLSINQDERLPERRKKFRNRIFSGVVAAINTRSRPACEPPDLPDQANVSKVAP